MARIFITGSSDGLGRMAAQLLVEEGHQVVLHARNANRGRDALAAVSGAAAVLTGDMASIAQTRRLAEAVNAHGPFDAVIHNAAIGFRERRRVLTEDGLPHVFAINTLAPYVLTALIRPPARLVYVSSELHRRGHAGLDDLLWERRDWRGNQAYSDTKLHDALLAFAVARRWPGVRSNALEPGWVATEDGRRARDGRPGRGVSHPGVACGVGRRRGGTYGGVFLPQAPAQAERRHPRCRVAGRVARGMRAVVRRAVPRPCCSRRCVVIPPAPGWRRAGR